jgi:hypothetical protein
LGGVLYVCVGGGFHVCVWGGVHVCVRVGVHVYVLGWVLPTLTHTHECPL